MNDEDVVVTENAAAMSFDLGASGHGDDLPAQVEAASAAIRSATTGADEADALTRAARASADAVLGARKAAEETASSALAAHWHLAQACVPALRVRCSPCHPSGADESRGGADQ